LRELFEISRSIPNEDWIKSPFPDLEQRDDKARRRLADVTDRWKAEEEEMRKELMKGIIEKNHPLWGQANTLSMRGAAKKSDNVGVIDNNRQIDTKRELQQFPISKTCTEPNDPLLGCPPPNLGEMCDKYHKGNKQDNNFEKCFQTCKKSLCCAHDSKRKVYDTETCAETAINCVHWIPCYIVWWKLSDTSGPATFFRLGQDDEFFNIDVFYIRDEIASDDKAGFYNHWFGRWADDDAMDIDDKMFEYEDQWIKFQNHE
jgi:hypothetical protein